MSYKSIFYDLFCNRKCLKVRSSAFVTTHSRYLTFTKGATFVLMSGNICKILLKARTTKDFFRFAIKHGVTYKQSSSSHIQLKSRNGVRMTLANVKSKKQLNNSATVAEATKVSAILALRVRVVLSVSSPFKVSLAKLSSVAG